MKNFIILALLTLAIVGCNKPQQPPTVNKTAAADSAFAALSEDFLTGYLAWRPQSGTYLGLHEYDGKVTDYSKASLDAELARLKAFDQKLTALDTTSLSPKNFYDYRILQAGIKNEIFSFDGMDSYSKNPMTYAGLSVDIYIKRNFAPLEDRVKSIIAIENEAPKIFAAAKANLADSLAKPYIETAIAISKGSADFLAKDLVTALKDVKNDSLMKAFNAANTKAIAELNRFATFLEKEKLPKAHLHYALGTDKYQKMLLYGELINYSPDKILEIGLAELKKEQDIFAAAAKKIDPTKKPIDVFKAIQKDHPTAEGLIPDTRKNLEAIRQFLIDKKIITIPSEVRAKVEETPQFARASSFASMDTPGPFEKKATEAFYYVTPVEKEWTAKQKEEWLTAFNYYTTDVVSIHEAYPGHYVQFLRMNASTATKIEKIFGSYAFIEGWAHYTEKMLIDEGYGADKDSVRAAKYRLAQSDEALLRLCRLCVSIKTHCYGMTLDEATTFFQENCYYEKKPAYQEALRGTFDPGYLYYTLGKLQILKLQSDYKAQEGNAYSLQKFNDEMTNYGMPPLRLLREVLLKDKSKANEIL
jgi:uncharacterized protein (DUF885 family)